VDGSLSSTLFRRVRIADPLRGNRLSTFAPSGAVAGVDTRTDAQRDVSKGAAGLDATLTGVAVLTVILAVEENGQVNPRSVYSLPGFTQFGWVVRGLAHAARGEAVRQHEVGGLELNNETLRAEMRLHVRGFMQNLFRQVAFQGSTLDAPS